MQALTTLMAGAAAPTLKVFRGITAERLTGPTPCHEYDVRALISHLLQWGPMLVAAGRKQTAGPVADEAGDEWLAALEKQTAELVDAWSTPSAWHGTAPMGGPVPARVVGGLALGELVVHGWDLARATGQDVRWPDDAVAIAYDAALETADQGRSMGAYGPQVDVAADASTMDRLLAVTGRDPLWTLR